MWWLPNASQQFEGVIWRFETGGQRREMPQEFGAYSSRGNRAHLRRRGIKAVIPELKAWRGVATPYDTTSESHLAGLYLRASDDPDRRPHPGRLLTTTRYAP